MKVQEAVRRETGRVVLHVVFMTLVILAVSFALHLASPKKTGFSYGTVFSILLGVTVGILNLFLMGLTVQYVTGLEDPKETKRFMQKSYVNRNTLQIVWMMLAVVVPVIHPVTGILPLLFPGLSVRLQGIFPPKEEQKIKQGGEI